LIQSHNAVSSPISQLGRRVRNYDNFGGNCNQCR